MNKPDIDKVLEIVRKKKEAIALYEEIDAAIKEIKAEFGACRFDYDLEQALDEQSTEDPQYDESLLKDGRYLKFEIVDNVAKMANGESAFAKAYVKPIVYEARSLKRCPESLK